MGKGFQNFMSKKDFHPSAFWNLKRKWELEQKRDLEINRQEELRIQAEKEQDMLNNKALLGDEKARLGLSFMYDAPAGINRKKDEGPEPKFEWQRKFNAPREDWAKGNELIQDQPFGIQVRNVRCVRCRTWGHLNTDRECPLYGMSGNADNPGYANNPSDLIKQMQTDKAYAHGAYDSKHDSKEWKVKLKIKNETHHIDSFTPFFDPPIKTETLAVKSNKTFTKTTTTAIVEDGEKVYDEMAEDEADAYYEAEAQYLRVPIDQDVLLEQMREEHNLRFKEGVLMGVRADENIRRLTSAIEEGYNDEGCDDEWEEKKDVKPTFEDFMRGMSEKKRKKMLKKLLKAEEPNGNKSKKKDNKEKKRLHKDKTHSHKEKKRSKERR